LAHSGDALRVQSLDIRILRHCHVCVPQNCLNRLVRHSQIVQVWSKSTPKSVPTVPFRTPQISLVFVLLFAMVITSLPAMRTDVEDGKDLTIQHIVQAQRRSLHSSKDRSDCGIPASEPELIQESLHWCDNRHRRFARSRFRFVDVSSRLSAHNRLAGLPSASHFRIVVRLLPWPTDERPPHAPSNEPLEKGPRLFRAERMAPCDG
jgi:hypothetical protein